MLTCGRRRCLADPDILVELLIELRAATSADEQSDAGGGASDSDNDSGGGLAEFERAQSPSSDGRSDMEGAERGGGGDNDDGDDDDDDDDDDGIDLSNASSAMDVLLTVMCAAFGIEERKARALVHDRGALLGRVMQNGVRGDFEPVADLLELVRPAAVAAGPGVWWLLPPFPPPLRSSACRS